MHTHNLKTNLGKILNYSYKPTKISNLPKIENCTFKGYQRENGDVGIRNNLWIVPTVNCVTSTVRYLEKIGKELIKIILILMTVLALLTLMVVHKSAKIIK